MTTRDGGGTHAADPPRYPDTGDDTATGGEVGSTAGRPRWVTVLVIVLAIGLVLLFVVLHLTGTLGPGTH